MKNKLADLNNHLFAQMERLSDEGTTGEALKEEIERAKAVTSVSKQIISNGTLLLNAAKAVSGGDIYKKDLPEIIAGKS